MAKLTFKTDLCKGCGLCVEACPKGLLSLDRSTLNARGYNPAVISEEALCISCAICARMCPDSVIKVEK